MTGDVPGIIMALVAAVLLGVGGYVAGTGRLPGPRWLRWLWLEGPPWRTAVGFIVLGVSSGLWSVSAFLGTTWMYLLASLIAGGWGLFLTIVRARERDREDLRQKRAWYRMPFS